ncbi:hypothetical protein GCM10027200_23710 [Lentzea nigeriaca]
MRAVHCSTASVVLVGWVGSIHGLMAYSTVKYVGGHMRYRRVVGMRVGARGCAMSSVIGSPGPEMDTVMDRNVKVCWTVEQRRDIA